MATGSRSLFPMFCIAAVALLSAGNSGRAEVVKLGELDLSKMSSGWGKPLADKSVTGKAISVGGQTFDHGVGTHAASDLYLDLDGQVERFQAFVGVDDAAGRQGSVRFMIYADGKRVFDSGLMKGSQKAKPVDVPLSGVKHLRLMVTSAGDGTNFDHANWAQAEFVTAGGKPVAVEAPKIPPEERVILTPKPGPGPRINGPKIHGARP